MTTDNQNFVSKYPPAMALEFLTEHCGMTDQSLAQEYRMSSINLARMRKGEHLPRLYDRYMRKLVKIVLQEKIKAMMAGDDELYFALSHLFAEMMRAHRALFSDPDFLTNDFWAKYYAP